MNKIRYLKHAAHPWRVLLLAAFLLTSCAEATPQDRAPNATPALTVAEAEDVARSFLDAWTTAKFDEMYNLISPRSQITSRDAFQESYRAAEQTLSLAAENPRTYTLHTDRTKRQGTTIIVTYDMKFNSTVLGEFSDLDRVMRLIVTPRGWRVAWSTMDIFEGMAGGATLRLDRTRATRGSIYDRNSRLIAQDNTPNYAVRLLTRNYPAGNPDLCFDRLAQIFRLYRPDLEKYKAFTGQDNGYTIGIMSEPDVQALRGSLDQVCLLEYRPQTSRFYFGGSFAPQTVGFVGPIPAEQVNNYPELSRDSLVGLFGVERFYQKDLGGVSGSELKIVTPDNVTVRTIYTRPAIPGRDVTLTIDRDFQLKVEQAVSDAYNAANWAQFSDGAAVVVLDVKTGEVLAMANYPSLNPDAWRLDTSFDTGTIEGYLKNRATVNHATEETYFLGSVMKIASTAAASSSGAFQLDEIVDCRGTYRSPDEDFTRTDWIYLEPNRDPNYHGRINLKQALTSSCDVYYWTVGARLCQKDPSLIKEYANRMGLGVRTGIDAVIEQEGYIPDPQSHFARSGKRWGTGDCLNIIIGQGDLQVTALQVARMMVAVANGEKVYRPYLVKTVGYPGEAPIYAAETGNAPDLEVTPEALLGIREALCEVTTNKKIGTAQWVFWNFDQAQVQVCGKTGTAQSGAPYPHGWFAAYVGQPGQTPDLAIAALVLKSREGSETAAPIVRRIIEAYYNLPTEPFPDFWGLPYELLPTPGLGEGGPPKASQ